MLYGVIFEELYNGKTLVWYAAYSRYLSFGPLSGKTLLTQYFDRFHWYVHNSTITPLCTAYCV